MDNPAEIRTQAPPVLRDLSACVFQERGVDSGLLGFLIGRQHVSLTRGAGGKTLRPSANGSLLRRHALDGALPSRGCDPDTTHANADRPFCCHSAL